MSRPTNTTLADSKSLYNLSLSPGWSVIEADTLKAALMKFGIGRWRMIEDSKVLPAKTAQQCYLQTQRIMGQQSLAEFMGLHVDIDQIAADNRKRQGIRKFGFLVNQLGKLTPEQKKLLIAENRIKYGLSEDVVANIKLPAPCHLLQVHSAEKILNPRLKLTTIEKINHFIKLKEALESKLDMLRQGKLILTGGQGRSLGALNKRGRPGANSFGGGPQKLMLASGVEGTGFYAGISSMKATATVEKGGYRKKRAVKEPQDGSDVDEDIVESDSEMRDCAAEMYTPDHQAFPGQGKSLLQARVKATTATTETTASTFDATPQ